MNRKIPYDRGLIMTVLALLGFGLIMVFSASTVVSAELYGSQTSIFTRQLLFVVIGLVGLMVSMKIDYHFYEQRRVVYSLLLLSLALLLYLFAAPESGGVQRWIRIGPANFQPSELAKFAVILFTSFYLATRKEEFHSFKRGLLPYLVVVGAIVLLVLLEPDLGTAASIALTALFLLFLGGLRYRYLLGLVLAAVPVLYFLVVRVPYRLDRFLAFLYPERDPFVIGDINRLDRPVFFLQPIVQVFLRHEGFIAPQKVVIPKMDRNGIIRGNDRYLLWSFHVNL